jgi:hypothetical protein
MVSSAVVSGVLVAGCLTRPVEPQPPTTKTNFTSKVKQQAIDKIDLLLAIDNSASMGDKQKFLARAVPNLVDRLVTPNCVDGNGKVTQLNGATGLDEDSTGQFGCPGGSKPEFKPIVDIHIGIVTSSMGGFGSDACTDRNDRGLAIKRGRDDAGKEAPVSPIEDGGFLTWYPTSNRHGKNPAPAQPYKDPKAISASVQSLVRGAGETGCGLEAQLESVYHFLIQPDPYKDIVLAGGKAAYSGIDNELIKARHDFLRPDSLVAVIMLTDEDDSSVDPFTVNGSGYNFMSQNFPGGKARADNLGGGTTAPRATKACETDPGSPSCTSCAFAKSDPGCADNDGYYKPEEDVLNVRFFDMKRRFGVDPQYPIRRYVSGFQSRAVPSRTAEHDGGGKYTDAANCTNPLFAKELPTALTEGKDEKNQPVFFSDVKDANGKPTPVCALARGDRSENLVFFAVIGGVPNDLLHFNPSDPDASRLTDEDWVKILGKDPVRFDTSGIDPRMVQSVTPRMGRPDPAKPDSDPTDPLNKSHRDWNTKFSDLQYACTFPIPETDRKKTYDDAGDCADGSDAPLCGGTGMKRIQVRAKAFPTVREFTVVRALGDQGIAASLCPQETSTESSEVYGYKPAVKAIVDRLANAISRQCLPRPLSKDGKGEVSCLMLAVLPDKTAKCGAGLEVTGAILTNFREQQKLNGETDKLTLPVCKIQQVSVAKGESCDGTSAANSKGTGWCYVTNDPGSKRCPQAIEFSPDAIVSGATVALQCIDQSGAGAAP